MTRDDAFKEVKRFEAFQIANKFARKHGAKEMEWDGDIVSKVKCQKRGDTTTLNFIGPILPFDDGAAIVEQIQNIETDKIKVNINSPGGDYVASLGIANALRDSDAEVTTTNLGLAASAGAILFAAGDNRLMAQGSELMIHNVMAGMIVFGNAGALSEAQEDLSNLINQLERTDKELAKSFSKSSNMTQKQVTAYMNKETFFNTEEAVDNGLATGTQEPKKARSKKTNTIQETAVEAVELLRNMFGNDTK